MHRHSRLQRLGHQAPLEEWERDPKKLVQVLEEANKLLESLQDVMSENEYYYIQESLNSKAFRLQTTDQRSQRDQR
jgi:hypothetical protein